MTTLSRARGIPTLNACVLVLVPVVVIASLFLATNRIDEARSLGTLSLAAVGWVVLALLPGWVGSIAERSMQPAFVLLVGAAAPAVAVGLSQMHWGGYRGIPPPGPFFVNEAGVALGVITFGATALGALVASWMARRGRPRTAYVAGGLATYASLIPAGYISILLQNGHT